MGRLQSGHLRSIVRTGRRSVLDERHKVVDGVVGEILGRRGRTVSQVKRTRGDQAIAGNSRLEDCFPA